MKNLAALLLALAAPLAMAGDIVTSWGAPTTNTDGTAIRLPLTYTLQWGPCNAAKTDLASVTGTQTGISALTFTVTNVAPGTWCLKVRTENADGVSAFTGAVNKVVVPPVPNPPTGLTVAQNTAFKMRQAIDSFSFVSIGTVELGSPCVDALAVEDATGRYTPVARNLVTLRNRFDTLPLIVYAHCA